MNWLEKLLPKGWKERSIPVGLLNKLDPVSIFREASKNWDGGYALAGILGTGDCFAMRDPDGIRPGYYFEDDEVFAVASERAPDDGFDKGVDEISEIQPGGILVMRPNGT